MVVLVIVSYTTPTIETRPAFGVVDKLSRDLLYNSK